MAETHRSDKTEQPTPKRKQDALKKGQVPRSRELTGVAVIAFTVYGLAKLADGDWGGRVLEHAVAPLREPSIWSGDDPMPLLLAILRDAIELMLLPAVIAFGSAVLAAFLQGRPTLSATPFEMKPDRFSPVKNLGKAFSPKRAAGLIVWGHLKVGLLFGAALWATWPLLGSFQYLIELQPAVMVATATEQLSGPLSVTLSCGILLGLGDYFHQRWQHAGELKMSRREIKDEHKQQEGDPLVKGRIRAIMREKSRRKMLAEVATATVVVTNPTHYSVAVRYRLGEDEVPFVVAKGKGHLAFRIRDEARTHGVPLLRSPALARTLYAEIDLGHPVAEAHYAAVAAVLVEVLSSEEIRQ
ncbi:MAG: EscU/YscU/HrcU family type III secretion system export apparatus switch protein [Acidobacteriota bacterium]